MRALIFHGPGDLRLEDVPRPEPQAEGDMLVQVEVALTDGTDAKAFRRGHPVLLGPPPSPFGHEFCGVDVATGRRVVAPNSAPCGACAPCRRDQETLCERLFPLLNGAYAEYLLVPARIADRGRAPCPRRAPGGGRGDGGASRLLPPRSRGGRCRHEGDTVADRRPRPGRADAVRLRA